MAGGVGDFLKNAEATLGNIGVIPERHNVPLEEIGPSRVADIIASFFGNELARAVEGDFWKNPFSVVNVLEEMGYVAPFKKMDYFQLFPKEYSKTREALQALVHKKALAMDEALKYPDENEERVYYRVVDEKKLREMMNEAKENV
jgi:hypothetical protein